MRILITGSIVFLIWVAFSSWLYINKIKPSFNPPAETAAVTDTAAVTPSPPPVVEAPKPGSLVLYFDFNKAEVKEISQNEQQSMLFIDWLGKHPDAILYITGHADSIGSDAYNKTLGSRRADNVKKYFTGKGVGPERITTDTKGESEPVADNSTEDGRAKNRRAEITLK